MNLLAIVFLLGLAVIVSGFPRPLGHGQSIIRHEFGGNGFDGSRNFGNWDFGHIGRQYDSPNNGDNYVSDRSVFNSNGFGPSGQNSAYMYDGSGPAGSDQVGDRSIGNINGFGASGQNSAYMYDDFGPATNDQVGRTSGNIFRNYGRDGMELGGYLVFE